MNLPISRRKLRVFGVVAIGTALIPILITMFELITTERQSVVFLEGYPTPVSILILAYYLVLIIAGIAWFIYQMISFFRLKTEKKKTELLHLKSQVNPHFFFNTLNNIYGLIETDTEKAKKLILTLSDMMRYSIYEGEKDTVLISAEITYLQKYIELHKMRYHKAINVTLDAEIVVDHEVMPLLFIILLENAFKHGIENMRNGAYATIHVESNQDQVIFTVVNNFDPSTLNEVDGIGLKNLKRRLEIVYPDRHTLSLTHSGDVYRASLILQV